MKAETKILMVFFFLVLLFPREAHVSGSAVGTITETHFEISGDDGLRKHFSDSGDEYEYHKREREKIAKALRPLADKIKALIERLRRKEPWSTLIQTYSHSADPGPDADLQQLGPGQTSLYRSHPGSVQARYRVAELPAKSPCQPGALAYRSGPGKLDRRQGNAGFPRSSASLTRSRKKDIAAVNSLGYKLLMEMVIHFVYAKTTAFGLKPLF